MTIMPIHMNNVWSISRLYYILENRAKIGLINIISIYEVIYDMIIIEKDGKVLDYTK